MKLINLAHSPYAARVRIQAYAKGIELQYVAPEGLRTPEFKRFNVLGRVPVLDTGSRLIPESIVIMDYLEDVHPQPALRPEDPEQRALMNVFYRFPDVYVQPALLPLFRLLLAHAEDSQAAAEHTAAVNAQLRLLDELMHGFGRDDHSRLDLADCALAPFMFYATYLPPLLKGGDPLAEAPRVTAWWQWLQAEAPVAKVLAELDEGLRAFLEKA